jgi:hypothetical protein
VPCEWMVLPSGRDTVRRGRVLTVVGVGQAAAVIKWPVLLVSVMAKERRRGEGGVTVGGPVIDRREGNNKTRLVYLIT